MAKTYEAMSKSGGSLDKHFTEDPASPDLIIKNQKNMEQLSNLEQQIALLMQKNNSKVFHFAGSREMEGVSNIVANLVQYMANKMSVKNILLIDANLQNPVLHNMFNILSSPGLRDVLSGNGSFSDSIHQMPSSIVYVMPCGKGRIDLSGGIGHEKLSVLISKIKTQYDCIIIDSPPLLASSDALSLAIVSDITFLVIQANKTLWEVAKKSKLYLEKNGCHIGGVVLNRVTHAIPEWIYKRL